MMNRITLFPKKSILSRIISKKTWLRADMTREERKILEGDRGICTEYYYSRFLANSHLESRFWIYLVGELNSAM